jgi:hypothetical protein
MYYIVYQERGRIFKVGLLIAENPVREEITQGIDEISF